MAPVCSGSVAVFLSSTSFQALGQEIHCRTNDGNAAKIPMDHQPLVRELNRVAIKRASEGMIVRHGENASHIEGSELTRFMGYLNEYLAFVEKVDKRIRNEQLTELIARAELTHRADFTSKSGNEVPAKLAQLHEQLVNVADDYGIKVSKPVEDDEHHTWSVCYSDSQGASRCIDYALASSPEFRQMMSKYSQISQYLEPPFLIEYAAKTTQESAADELEGTEFEEGQTPPKVKAEAKAARRGSRIAHEPVEKQTARELFAYIVEQGKKEYDVQRYKGLGEMTAPQLWETTMDPDRRTLLQVKLEDIAETETIFTTLMGEDVESRRKFIEDNALDVKNLDI